MKYVDTRNSLDIFELNEIDLPDQIRIQHRRLTLNTSPVTPISVILHRGEEVSRSGDSEFRSLYDCTMKGVGPKGEEVSFCMEISTLRSHIESTSNDLCGEVAAFASRRVESYLCGLKRLSLFETAKIRLDHDSFLSKGALPETVFICEIQVESLRESANQVEWYLAGRQDFTKAVARLNELAGLHPEAIKYCWGEICGLLSFLETSLQCGNLGNMYSWYREKLSGIRTYFDDMHGRKNAKHPGYTTARGYIKSNLYSFAAPRTWNRQPPKLPIRA